MEENIMEQQLIRCFKVLVEELCDPDNVNIEVMVDKFLQRSELTISPASREDLIKHIYYTISMQGTE